jgi:hypothetical protein
LAEIEKRYGAPLAEDHKVFLNPPARELLSIPKNKGIYLWIELIRLQGLSGQLPNADNARNTLESYAKALSARVYLFNNVLIQVVFFQLKSGTQFSYSEAMYAVEERNGRWVLDGVTREFLEQVLAKTGEQKTLPGHLNGVIPDKATELASLDQQIDEADRFRSMEDFDPRRDETQKKFENLTQRWSVLVGVPYPPPQPGIQNYELKGERGRLERASTRGALPIDGTLRPMGSGPSRLWLLLSKSGGKIDPMYDLLDTSDPLVDMTLRNQIKILSDQLGEAARTKKSINGF